MPEKIKRVPVGQGYLEAMVKYSIIVDRRRALPEVRDSFKPVQRNILYDMFIQGATSYSKRIKSSAIVGDTMKLFHPHGDSSIYGAMAPLAVDFSSKIPLLAPKGNWGSLMGDKPAHMRYTETGLSEFAIDCVLGELLESDNVVNYVQNYSKNKKRPEYLPTKVPLLLINGTFGIGVGIQVSISTHNLGEVIDAARALIHNPKSDVILIPDHCQPCEIIDTDWKRISEVGNGSYRARGIVEIGTYQKDPALFVRSLPNGVSTKDVMDSLDKLILAKQLPMVKDINDGSGTEVEIIIQLKKGSDPYYVREVLYAKTKVQNSYTINFEVVDGTEVKRMSYKEYLTRFIQTRMKTVFRKYCNKLQMAATRHHQLEAYIRIMEAKGEVDRVYKMIRQQKNVDNTAMVEYLIKKLNITDIQAKYILGVNFQRLAMGYLPIYKEEYQKLSQQIAEYEPKVTDGGKLILQEIDEELAAIKTKYNTKRICKVIKAGESNNIPKGIFKIVITERNYIRKLPDVDRVGAVKKDNPKFIIRCDNTENILLFDNKGKVFKLPVHKIPLSDRSSSGTDIRILVKNLTSNIISVWYEPIIKQIVEGSRKHFMAVVTKSNSIKRLDLEDLTTVNMSGLMYSKISPDDEVAGLVIAPANLDVVVYSTHKALRIPMKNVPQFKRAATGSKAMNTTDEIEGISVIYPDAEYIVVITKNGYINRFNVSGLSQSDRAKAGSAVIRLSSGDSILSIYGASENDLIRVVTSEEVQEIPVSSVKLFSSVAKGTKVVSTRSTNIVRTDIIKGTN